MLILILLMCVGIVLVTILVTVIPSQSITNQKTIPLATPVIPSASETVQELKISEKEVAPGYHIWVRVEYAESSPNIPWYDAVEWNIDDVITTDKYLRFCRDNGIDYAKTDFLYTGEQIELRNQTAPKSKDLGPLMFFGHSDYAVTDEVLQPYENLQVVFCINNQSTQSTVYGLPLGITNCTQESVLHSVYGDVQIMRDVADTPKRLDTWAYMNINTLTYPQERVGVYDLFKDQDWVVLGQAMATTDGRRTYLEALRSSRFSICPRGNGIDTHRIWESLYMGCIPIVRYDPIAHREFVTLPILFVDDWAQVTLEYLHKEWERINTTLWIPGMLKISYWKQFIFEKIIEINK